MKKYEYVSLSYSSSNMVMASMNQHREIIDQYAQKGYTFIGMIPIEISANGCIRKIDLIFEAGK